MIAFDADGLAHMCGSRQWIAAMAARAPFADGEAVFAAADACFAMLAEADWLEAFAHHPRIGDVSRLRERFAGSGELSHKEQGVAVQAANELTIARLFELNQTYEARHGHVFIVCASGKSADEMLALLETRIDRAPADELLTCADEQQKITRLRLTARVAAASGALSP